MIVTQHAAEPLSTVDGSVAWELGEFRANDLVLEPLMIPFHMIMQNEFRDGSRQSRLPDRDQSVQTGLFDAANEAFGEGIQIG